MDFLRPQVTFQYVRTTNDLCEPLRVGEGARNETTLENTGKTRKAESGGSRLVVLTRG